MDKLLLFPGRTEKGIFTYVIDAEKNYLEKTASEYHPTIASFIHNAKPIKDKTQVLLTALGAGEYWGNNVNGDWFGEEALAHEGDDYGYKTFEKYAKVRRHHLNKPHNEAYGDVLLSVYNPVFHRVELIITFDHHNAYDLAERINRGESLDFSMGCRVNYDVCNICGNKAPTRAQYCDHLRYHMGKYIPSIGKMAYAINPMPKFFDISVVLLGADRIAKSLRKVASPYRAIPIISSAYLAEKMAERQKQGTITKEIPADQPPSSADKVRDLAKTITEVKSMEAPLPKETLDSLAKHPLPKIMSTMTMMGILPKPQEFQRIYLIRAGHRDLADKLDKENIAFDPMSVEHPSAESHKEIDLGPHNFSESLMNALLPFMGERSYAAPHLGRRLVIMIKSGQEYRSPRLIKVAEGDERKPLGPLIPLLAAAGAYAALLKTAPKSALSGVDKILSTPGGVGLATILGLGMLKIFNTVTGPRAQGQFSSAQTITNPDTNDMFARIEQLKQKPFHKVGFHMGSAAKRLFLGVPAAYMASGVLQKQKELSPYDEEGRIRSFVRQNPDVVSAALIADAVLSAKGHPISTRSLFVKAKELAKNAIPQFKAKVASELSDLDPLSKIADAQDFLSSSLIWPLAMGKTSLPGRIVEGLFDQAALEAGSQLLKKRKKDHKSKQPNLSGNN
jgi:hypothetical protein